MEGGWFPLELPLAELQLRFEEPYGAISRFLVVVDSARRALINVVEMATAGVPNMGTSYDITVDDALRISGRAISRRRTHRVRCPYRPRPGSFRPSAPTRSEEHTSELQSLMRISYAV